MFSFGKYICLYKRGLLVIHYSHSKFLSQHNCHHSLVVDGKLFIGLVLVSMPLWHWELNWSSKLCLLKWLRLLITTFLSRPLWGDSWPAPHLPLWAASVLAHYGALSQWSPAKNPIAPNLTHYHWGFYPLEMFPLDSV